MIKCLSNPDMKWHPSAQKNSGSNGGNNEHIHVFSQKEKGKFDPGIFGMKTGSKFRFCFSQVERSPVGFGSTGNQENNKSNKSRNMTFENPPSIGLTFKIAENCMVPAKTTMVSRDSPTESS